jgi:hypothetical protein
LSVEGSDVAISIMRCDSRSERPKVGCAVSTTPVRARDQRVLNASKAASPSSAAVAVSSTKLETSAIVAE